MNRIALSLVILLTLAACGGGGSSSSSAPETAPPSPSGSSNSAPQISAADSATVSEGQTDTGIAINTSDTDGDEITLAINGADASAFTLQDSDRIVFITAPDYEVPGDSDGDNVYQLTLEASDGELTTSLAVEIHVEDALIAPVFEFSTAENHPDNSLLVGDSQVTASVPELASSTGIIVIARAESGATLPVILQGVDVSRFKANPDGSIEFVTTPDFEAPADVDTNNVYEFEVTTSDGEMEVSQTVALSVLDLEPLTDLEIQQELELEDKETGDLAATFAFSPLDDYTGFLAGLGQVGARVFITRNCELTAPLLQVPSISPDGYTHLLELPCDIEVLNGVQTMIDATEHPPLLLSLPADLETHIDDDLTLALQLVETTAISCDHGELAQDPASGDYSLMIPGSTLTTGENTVSCALENDFYQGDQANSVDLVISGTENHAPVFVSAVSTDVSEGTAASFYPVQATDQDDDLLTYSITGGADAALFTVDSVSGAISFITTPDFDAPLDEGADNIYVLELSVVDPEGATDQLQLTIQVLESVPPVADAGNDVSANEGQAVSLQGSGTDEDGTIDSYRWQQLSGPSAIISSTTAPAPTVFLPGVSSTTTLELELTVTDNSGDTASDILRITVFNVNQPPTADAGIDQTVSDSDPVNLSGQASDDTSVASVSWMQTGGTAVTLNGAGTLTPTFTAPVIAGASEDLTFSLTATDNNGLTATDSVVVQVQSANTPVGAVTDVNVGANNVLTGAGIGTSVSVTASATDVDGGDTVTYSLTDDDGGTFSINATTGVVVTAAAVDAAIQSAYSITVQATSTDGTTSSASFGVTVLTANTPPEIALLFPPVVGLYDDTTLNVRGSFTDDDGDSVDVTVDDGAVMAGATTDLASGTWDGGAFTPPVTGRQMSITVTGEDATTSAATNTVSSTLENRAVVSGSSLLGVDETGGRVFTLAETEHLLTWDESTDAYTITPLGTGAGLEDGEDMLWDPVGNRLLVVDSSLDDVYALDVSTGNATELSGDTVGAGTPFSSPGAMALNAAGTTLYVADGGTVDGLFAVDMTTGNRTIISDGTTGSGPVIAVPRGLALDEAGNRVFVSDSTADAIYEVDLATGNRSLVSDAATGSGIALAAPSSLTYDPVRDQLYVQDSGVVTIDATTGNRSLLKAAEDGFNPNRIEYSATDDTVYIADYWLGVDGASSIDPDSATVTTLFSLRIGAGPHAELPFDVVPDLDDERLILIDQNCDVFAMNLATGQRTVLSRANGSDDCVLMSALSSDGSTLYGVDFRTTGIGLWEVDLTTGVRNQISGDASGSGPAFDTPFGITLNAAGDAAYIADSGNDRIYLVNLATGARSIFSSDNIGSGPDLDDPESLALDAAGNQLFVVNQASDNILAVDLATGNRTLLSGDDAGVGSRGLGPDLEFGEDCALDPDDNRLLVVDQNGFLMSVDLTTGDRAYVSGRGQGRGPDIEYPTGLPFGIGIDAANDIAWMTDWNYSVILTVDLNTGDRIISSY